MDNNEFFENMDFFEGLKERLKEAISYENGDKSRVRITVRELPIPEYSAGSVAQIRKGLNLSQKGLATALGVSTRTVEAWEAGRNVPNGAARHLLYLLDKDKSLVSQLIAN